jgi:hypothetical protein
LQAQKGFFVQGRLVFRFVFLKVKNSKFTSAPLKLGIFVGRNLEHEKKYVSSFSVHVSVVRFCAKISDRKGNFL